MLARITAEHINRANRMIGCGLDLEKVSQWLATHDADKAELKRLWRVSDAGWGYIYACEHNREAGKTLLLLREVLEEVGLERAAAKRKKVKEDE